MTNYEVRIHVYEYIIIIITYTNGDYLKLS